MRRSGMTLLDVVVALGCLLTLSAIISCGGLRAAQDQARIAKDRVQLKGLSQACHMYANYNEDRFPTPSHEARLPMLMDGRKVFVPGRGAPDWAKNTSANIVSFLVSQQFCTPEFLVSPLENHPRSRVYDNYDYSLYDPSNGTFWDPGLLFDPSDVKKDMHSSYANQAISELRLRNWTTSIDPRNVMFSSRGPAGAVGADYEDSPTLLFMSPDNQWVGNAAYGDGSVGQVVSPIIEADRLFCEDDPWKDQWMGVFVGASDDGLTVTAAFDPLIQ